VPIDNVVDIRVLSGLMQLVVDEAIDTSWRLWTSAWSGPC